MRILNGEHLSYEDFIAVVLNNEKITLSSEAKKKIDDSRMLVEELDKQDLTFEKSKVTIHIFSQILDIPFANDFDTIDFFETITNTEGKHYILVVSHDSDAMGGGNQIRQLYRYIVDNYIEQRLPSVVLFKKNEIKKFASIITLKNFQIDTTQGEKDSISMFACIDTKYC